MENSGKGDVGSGPARGWEKGGRISPRMHRSRNPEGDSVLVRMMVNSSKILYLVRHGSTEWNEDGRKRFQGTRDIPLSLEGYRQAENLAGYFQTKQVSGILSSPLRRATETAERICKGRHGLTVSVTPILREMEFGVWEGLFVSDVQRLWPETWTQWMETPQSARIPAGESLLSLFSRANQMLELVLHHPGNALILVGHGAILRAIITILRGLPAEHLNRVRLRNGALTAFDLSSREYQVVLDDHLPSRPIGV